MDEEDALRFLKLLKSRRAAQVDNLIGAAGHSTDPAIRSNWAAIAQLDQVIDLMEKERGNPDE
jgi:hypothetical protein